MREILFRGKGDRKYNSGNWYHGYLSKDCDGDYVITEIGFSRTVIPETVGQFTGLTDKNGKKIFEGDIVKYENKIYEIKYLEKYARFAPSNEHSIFMVCAFNHLEVVGNIHDNPGLLKGE